MHPSPNSIFSQRFALVILFCVCVCYGCNRTPEQKRKAMVEKYQKADPVDKNKALCDCLHPGQALLDTLKASALIEAGADVNQNCEYTGHSETFWSLIGVANPKAYEISFTPTIHFFLDENLPLLDQCFKHGGTVDSSLIEQTKNLETWQYLFSKGWGLQHFSYFSSDIAQDPPRLDFLLARGFGINDSINRYGHTFFYALSTEVIDDDTTLFAHLLSKGANINPVVPDQNIPIFNVVENKQPKVFRWMLRNGAKVEGVKNNWRQTLLQYIIDKSAEDDLYDMLAALNENGYTESLDHYDNVENAIVGRNYKMLKLMLAKGVSTRNRMDTDENAFKEALVSKDSVSLKILLEARPREADINALIKECESDREYWASDQEIVQRLTACLRILTDFKQKRATKF